MSYIPKDAKWYLADIVIEHRIEGDTRNVIHINTLLVRANSPERAYTRAMKLGQEAQYECRNSDDKEVQLVFRGLAGLSVIHDQLRSGAELIYQERIGLMEEQVEKLILPKAKLDVFEETPKPSKDKPNYMPKDIMEGLGQADFTDNDLFS